MDRLIKCVMFVYLLFASLAVIEANYTHRTYGRWKSHRHRPTNQKQPVYTRNGCPAHLANSNRVQVYGDMCYLFEVDRMMNYNGADRLCRHRGGVLASVTSMGVRTFLTDELQRKYRNKGYMWIGLGSSRENTQGMCQAINALNGGILGYKTCQMNNLSYRPQYFICQFPTKLTPAIKTPIQKTRPPLPLPTSVRTSPVTATYQCPVRLANQRAQVYGNKCYLFKVDRMMNYYRADGWCRHQGGVLASVTSMGVKTFLTGELQRKYRNKGYMWIGLGFSGEIRRYNTQGMCQAIYALNGRTVGYQTCQMNNLSHHPHYFICEFPTKLTPAIKTPIQKTRPPLPLPPSVRTSPVTATYQCPARLANQGAQVYGNKCYLFKVDRKLNYEEADRFCQHQRGILASVTSSRVRHFLTNELRRKYRRKGYMWVGVSSTNDIRKRKNKNKKNKKKKKGSSESEENNYDYNYKTQGQCQAIYSRNGKIKNSKMCQRYNWSYRAQHFICEFPLKPKSQIIKTPIQKTRPPTTTTTTTTTTPTTTTTATTMPTTTLTPTTTATTTTPLPTTTSTTTTTTTTANTPTTPKAATTPITTTTPTTTLKRATTTTTTTTTTPLPLTTMPITGTRSPPTTATTTTQITTTARPIGINQTVKVKLPNLLKTIVPLTIEPVTQARTKTSKVTTQTPPTARPKSIKIFHPKLIKPTPRVISLVRV